MRLSIASPSFGSDPKLVDPTSNLVTDLRSNIMDAIMKTFGAHDAPLDKETLVVMCGEKIGNLAGASVAYGLAVDIEAFNAPTPLNSVA